MSKEIETMNTFDMIQRGIKNAGKMKAFQEINNACIGILTEAAEFWGFDVPAFLKTEMGHFMLHGGAPLLLHFIIEKNIRLVTMVIKKEHAAFMQKACEQAFTAEVFLEFDKLTTKLLNNGIQEHIQALVSLGKQVSEVTDSKEGLDLSKASELLKASQKMGLLKA